jgi:hypothetical protein
MADEKRIIEGYEEMHCIRLGGGEVIIAENKTAENRYMVCDCSWDNLLGIDWFTNAVGSADYLEIMKALNEMVVQKESTVQKLRDSASAVKEQTAPPTPTIETTKPNKKNGPEL